MQNSNKFKLINKFHEKIDRKLIKKKTKFNVLIRRREILTICKIFILVDNC